MDRKAVIRLVELLVERVRKTEPMTIKVGIGWTVDAKSVAMTVQDTLVKSAVVTPDDEEALVSLLELKDPLSVPASPMKRKCYVTARGWTRELHERFGDADGVHELTDAEVVDLMLAFGRAEFSVRKQVPGRPTIYCLEFQNEFDDTHNEPDDI
jgi:hypothetical protein